MTATLDPKIRATLNSVALELHLAEMFDLSWEDLVDAVMCATNVPDNQIAALEAAAKETL